jgi:hypothetical protein
LFFINLSSLTTVDIAGIGNATVTDPSAVYAFPPGISTTTVTSIHR